MHGRNALELAQWLSQQPAVSKVFYPGLPTHPGHEIALRQQSGFGAIVTFELAGGIPAVKAFVAGLKYFSLAESLGGVESLIAHPASMTHAAMEEPRSVGAKSVSVGQLTATAMSATASTASSEKLMVAPSCAW